MKVDSPKVFGRSIGTRPADGWNPTVPDHAEGMRIEPPASVPPASATMPSATAAAEPPDEPPGLYSVLKGFLVGPKSLLSVTPRNPSTGLLVAPMTMPPARSIDCAGGIVIGATNSTVLGFRGGTDN